MASITETANAELVAKNQAADARIADLEAQVAKLALGNKKQSVMTLAEKMIEKGVTVYKISGVYLSTAKGKEGTHTAAKCAAVHVTYDQTGGYKFLPKSKFNFPADMAAALKEYAPLINAACKKANADDAEDEKRSSAGPVNSMAAPERGGDDASSRPAAPAALAEGGDDPHRSA
jgi:hypothetical protein